MNITDSETKGRAFEPRKRKNRDTTKVGAYYLYNCVAMDLTKDTFKEAIQNNNYTKDECFLNIITGAVRQAGANTKNKKVSQTVPKSCFVKVQVPNWVISKVPKKIGL
jgi:hypothetical protein